MTGIEYTYVFERWNEEKNIFPDLKLYKAGMEFNFQLIRLPFCTSLKFKLLAAPEDSAP